MPIGPNTKILKCYGDDELKRWIELEIARQRGQVKRGELLRACSVSEWLELGALMILAMPSSSSVRKRINHLRGLLRKLGGAA